MLPIVFFQGWIFNKILESDKLWEAQNVHFHKEKQRRQNFVSFEYRKPSNDFYLALFLCVCLCGYFILTL